MNYIERFYDILEDIAKEYNPEEDVYPDFEDLFENKILEELDLTEDEYDYAKIASMQIKIVLKPISILV